MTKAASGAMRTFDYTLHTYRLRYARPVRWSDIVEEAAPFELLRLRDKDGAAGVAEITVKPTWCGVTARSLIASVEEVLMPRLAANDLSDPAAVRRILDQVPDNEAAKTLIDCACWDLHAARQGRSLRSLWNGAPRVELSGALTRAAPSVMAAEAVAMIARHGFRVLKIKGGQGIATDRAVIRAVRAAVGDTVTLYVDANGFYSADEAWAFVAAMAEEGAVIVEDPCALAPNRAFRRLQEQSPVPILVDFGSTSLRDAGLFLEQGARALSIKPGRFGLTQSRAMLDLALRENCQPVVGLMGESLLGTLAGLAFASAVPASVLPAELSWYLAMTEQVVTVMPPIVDGYIDLPEVAGLDQLVDWNAVRRFSLDA